MGLVPVKETNGGVPPVDVPGMRDVAAQEGPGIYSWVANGQIRKGSVRPDDLQARGDIVARRK
jgi:hypothetical protein